MYFFVRFFPLVAAVSFPNAPLHPPWVPQPGRSSQPVAGEKQTLWLAQCFPIPHSLNKGRHWISGALHVQHFPVSVRLWTDNSCGLVWGLVGHGNQKRGRRGGGALRLALLAEMWFRFQLCSLASAHQDSHSAVWVEVCPQLSVCSCAILF